MTGVPDVHIEKRRASWWDSASLVWLIPLGAVVIAMFVAWQSYNDRGRVIHVKFDNGAGLLADSTELRFRDVTVGLVEKVSLSENLEGVDVEIRLTREVSPFVDEAAQFWVVRPELTTQGVTGLETVLSGVYIEGVWDSAPGAMTTSFEGRSDVPLFRSDKPGLQFSLRSSPRGQLTAHSPILFRGIEVGRVGAATIDLQGSFAVADAIIYEPHDQLINSSTRFWDTSGFSISLGAAGASVDFSSLASLVAGGITFETFVSGGDAAVNGDQFQVFDGEESARDSVFNQSLVEELTVSVVFDDNIPGLSVDAPVELSGLRIGSVSSVFGVVDAEHFGDSRVRLNAVLAIQPTRLGLSDDVSPEAAEAFLRARIDEGLRAQLASGSLLAGGLKVQFVEVDDAGPAEVRETEDGMAILPTIPSEIDAGQANVEAVLARINGLPVEELMNSAIDFLETARGFVSSDAIRETPEDLRKLLATVTEVVASEDIKAIPTNLNQVLEQVEMLLKQLETEQMAQRAAEALAAAVKAATTLDESVAGVPALITELTEVAKTARSLPLKDLTERLSGIVETTDALIQTEGVQELPEQLSAALAELNATLGELREGGAVSNVNATLSSARDAADAVAVSARDLPELTQRLTDVLDQASKTIQGYDRGEALSRDAQAAMRDIQQAASAITALARTLERNPSALIRGAKLMSYFKAGLVACAMALAGCGTAPDLVAVNEPTAQGSVRVSLASLELREPSLPGYAVADEIIVESDGGTLSAVGAVLWADKPARAISLELSRHLASLTRVRIAPSPWPFEAEPDGVLDLRFETLLARADGTLVVSGQYFLARLDGGRERSGVFNLSEQIELPATPVTISNARGKAIAALANLLAREALR